MLDGLLQAFSGFSQILLESIQDNQNCLNLVTQEVFQKKSYSETHEGFNKLAVIQDFRGLINKQEYVPCTPILRLWQPWMKTPQKWVGHSDGIREHYNSFCNFCYEEQLTPKIVFLSRVSGAFQCWPRSITSSCTESRLTEQRHARTAKDRLKQSEIKTKPPASIYSNTASASRLLEKGLHIFQEDLQIIAEKQNQSQFPVESRYSYFCPSITLEVRITSHK